MLRIAIALLLLSVSLFAETQEAAYFRAMQAEESGDIALAIKSFEEALDIDGEYTDEIQEILNEYYDALGIPLNKRHRHKVADGSSQEEVPPESPFSYRFLADLNGTSVYHTASGMGGHWGGTVQGSFSGFLDYSRGDWLHSFGVNLLADYNINNREVPALDSNDWKGTIGLEYMLVGSSLLLDVGVDVNLYEKADVTPAFYTWTEYQFFKTGSLKFGSALWAFYDVSGPLSVALYASLRKTSTYGFSFSVLLGPRLEMDSTYDYVTFRDRYNAAMDEIEQEMNDYSGYDYGTNPFNQCLELYGEQCYDWNIATVDSLNWVTEYERLLSEVNVEPVKYWAKWLGPSVRTRALYRFKNGFSLEAKMNLFYSFVLDGPDDEYNKISRFTTNVSGMLYWNPGIVELYLGCEDVFRYYSLPETYQNIYSRYNTTFRIRLGSKWDF